MYHSIKLIEVKGFHVLSSKTILEHECVTLVEDEQLCKLTFNIGFGLSHNIEKKLDENPQFFDDFKSIYLLFSEDGMTYQGVRLFGMRHTKKGRHEYFFEADVTESPSDYEVRVVDYLVRKA